METLEKITVFCYGETGVGKSYFLNMLCGNEGDNDDPFKTAATCDSVTKNPKIVESHIFGNKQAPIIRIMDIPGIFDTEDLDAEKSNKQPVSIDHLKNLNKTVQEQFGGKVNRILVCFDATKRFGKLQDSVIEIARLFMPNLENITVLILKWNLVSEKKRAEAMVSWKERLQKSYNLKKVFFVGCLNIEKEEKDFDSWGSDTEHGQFQMDILSSSTDKLKKWEELGNEGQKIVGQNIKQQVNSKDCFSLDMLVTIKRNVEEISANQLIELNRQIYLQSTDNTLLDLLHYSCTSYQLFLQIVLDDQSILECSDNHLIYVENYKSFKTAKEIRIGDRLLRFGVPQVVKQINQIIKQGFFCPLTTNGKIEVNGILASCYVAKAGFITQNIAHQSMIPLIWYKKLTGMTKRNKGEEFISSYAHLLQQMFT